MGTESERPLLAALWVISLVILALALLGVI